MLRRLACLAPLVGLGLLPGGCDQQTSMPGTPLGTFTVQATTKENTCGADLGAPDPWRFDVELSREENLLHWRQNGATLSGTLDSSSQTKISSTQTGPVGQAGQSGACTMGRTDTLAVALGPGDLPTALSGSLTFSFATDSAPGCGAQLTSGGGTFAALPCQIVYTLSAERSKAP